MHDQDAVAHPDQLGQVGRDHDDADTRGGKLTQLPVDLGPGAHIHSAGRLIKDDHLRVDAHPHCHQAFLLVAARQVEHFFLDRRGLDVICADTSARQSGRSAGGSGNRSRCVKRRREGAITILAQRHPRKRPKTFAVFGQVGDALLNGILRAVDLERVSVQVDLAAVFAVDPEDRPPDLRPPGADQASKPKDLAPAAGRS